MWTKDTVSAAKGGLQGLGTHCCLRNVLCKACHASIRTYGSLLLIHDGTATGRYIASPTK